MVEYIRYKSGYCYKVAKGEKTRISESSYRKGKKSQGGVYEGIHPSNINKSQSALVFNYCLKNKCKQRKDMRCVLPCIREYENRM